MTSKHQQPQHQPLVNHNNSSTGSVTREDHKIHTNNNNSNTNSDNDHTTNSPQQQSILLFSSTALTPTRSHRSAKMTNNRSWNTLQISPSNVIASTTIATTTATTPVAPREEAERSTLSKPHPKSSDILTVKEMAYAELAEMKNPISSLLLCNKKSISSSTSSSSSSSSPEKVVPSHHQHYYFPAACRTLLLELPGNQQCLDCGSKSNRPEWACVSYGSLVCIHCSGHHRRMGVQTSTVRHITMDHWTYPQVLQMLEGGNAQLEHFFQRHLLTPNLFLNHPKKKKHSNDDNDEVEGVDDEDEDEDEVFEKVDKQSSSPNGSKTTTATNTTTTTTSSSILNIDNLSYMRYKTKAALFYRQQLEHHVQRLLSTGQPYQGRRPKNQSQQQQRSTPTTRNNNDNGNIHHQRQPDRQRRQRPELGTQHSSIV